MLEVIDMKELDYEMAMNVNGGENYAPTEPTIKFEDGQVVVNTPSRDDLKKCY